MSKKDVGGPATSLSPPVTNTIPASTVLEIKKSRGAKLTLMHHHSLEQFRLADASTVSHFASYDLALMPTTCAMKQMEERTARAFWDRDTRVKVFTPSGVQIGIPGVGEGDNRLTFPRKYLVGDALSVKWIRFATAGEGPLEEGIPEGFATLSSHMQEPKWWRYSELQPQSLIYCGPNGDDFVAQPDQPMGLLGNRMTALAQKAATNFTEKPCHDLEDIRTPSTPTP